MLILLVFISPSFWWCLCLFFCVCVYSSVALQNMQRRAIQHMVHEPLLCQFFRHIRSPWQCAKYAAAGFAAGVVLRQLYKSVQAFRAWKRMGLSCPHSGLSPESDEERDERDNSTNIWSRATASFDRVPTKSKTTTHEQLEGLVFRNLCYLRRLSKDGVPKFCNAIGVKGNIMLIPYHMLTDEELKFEFYRAGPDDVGTKFSAVLSRKSCSRIGSGDFALIAVPSAGEFRNLEDYINFDIYPSIGFSMVWKNKQGLLERYHGKASPMWSANNGVANFPGAEYTLDKPTFDGMCMATMICRARYPRIAGFHLGGTTGQPYGICGILMRSEYDNAMNTLMGKRTTLPVVSAAPIPTKQMGHEFYLGEELHYRSEVNFLEPGTNLTVLGSCEGRAEYHSSVVSTPIAATVAKVFSCDKRWGKPKFHRWRPWQASLTHAARPCDGLSPSVLTKALECYEGRLIVDIFSKLSASALAAIHPLDNIDNVSGIDGKRFIDAIDPNTSMGYPVNKSKREFLIDVEDLTHNSPKNFPEWIWDEVSRCEEAYLRGERAYPIFKACLKDEPTLVTKDKVRVFQAAPIHLGLLIRRYFLPIVRELSMYPLISECAVGINCQGPEWDELTAHITQHGSDHIIAGDYSKYDLRLPPEVTHGVFRILLNIAKYVGYSDRNLTIMAGIATDVVYPVVAYNGTLLKQHGGNPSGQNLTVYLNSMANSVLCRYGFYTIYPDASNNFHKAVALTTYGDDFKGSVHCNFHDFNHIGFKQVLATFGMVLTMPDKEADPIPFLKDSDCDFLKRRSIYIPEIGTSVGALDTDSVIKSLMAVLRSQAISLTEQTTVNMSGALQEMFFHGRGPYNEWQEKLRNVLAHHPELGFIPGLDNTFDDRVLAWKERYNKE
jgi:hypothetical protein